MGSNVKLPALERNRYVLNSNETPRTLRHDNSKAFLRWEYYNGKYFLFIIVDDFVPAFVRNHSFRFIYLGAMGM